MKSDDIMKPEYPDHIMKPEPVRLFRLTHIDNLPTLLKRGELHAPNYCSEDGLSYRTIHDEQIQARRHERMIPCSRQGTVHDYLPFYLGPRSPMLYKLASGGVEGYDEGQAPLVYLVAWASDVQQAELNFAFSDGHGIAAFTRWFDDVAKLDQLDWPTIYSKEWGTLWKIMIGKGASRRSFWFITLCPGIWFEA